MDDEVVIVHDVDLAHKPIDLKPHAKVQFPRVFGDVGRCMVTLGHQRPKDVTTESPRPQKRGTQASILTSIVASTTM